MEEIYIKQEPDVDFEPEDLPLTSTRYEEENSHRADDHCGSRDGSSDLDDDFNADIRFRKKRMATWSTSCDRRPNKRRQVFENHVDLPFNSFFSQKNRKSDCFQFFFGGELLESICTELNGNYKRELEAGILPSRLAKWKDKTPKALYKFLGLTLLMSRVIKHSMDEYWSKDVLLDTPIFKQVMSRDEYQAILKMLSFPELSNNDENTFTLTKVLNCIRKQYFAALIKTESDDEQECLTFLKERLLLKQFNQKTKNKYDRKIFVLCDSVTGYILDFTTFTAPNTNPRRIVPEGSNDDMSVFLSPYLQKGYKLFIDNWWNSPDLFMWLYDQTKNKKTCNRQHMATLEKKMRRKSIYFSLLKNNAVLKWLKSKNMFQLSAYDVDVKYEDILDYDDNQALSAYEEDPISGHEEHNSDDEDIYFSANSSRRTNNWHRKYFFHLVNISVINAKVIYEGIHKKKESLSRFQLEMVRELLEEHGTSINKHSMGRRTLEEESLHRLETAENGHYPSFIPSTGKKIRLTRVCVVCHKNKKRKETRYQCDKCNVSLCVVPCFQVYHTVRDY